MGWGGGGRDHTHSRVIEKVGSSPSGSDVGGGEGRRSWPFDHDRRGGFKPIRIRCVFGKEGDDAHVRVIEGAGSNPF